MVGIDAASELAKVHATYKKDQGATSKHFNAARKGFMEQSDFLREQAKKVVRHDKNS